MRPVMAESASPSYRCQDSPATYALNGAVCLARREWFAGRTSFLSEETICYVTPRERSIDIDTEMDMTILNAIVDASKEAIETNHLNAECLSKTHYHNRPLGLF